MLRVNLFMSVAMTFSVLSTVVQAESVPLLVNQTTGATIFDDNFESGTVNAIPVATVGTWTAANGDSMVLSATEKWAGAPMPLEGTKMAGLWVGPGTTYLWGKGVTANSGGADVIKLELAFQVQTGMEYSIYAKSGGDDIFKIGLWGPAASTYSTPMVNNSIYAVSSDWQSWINTGLVQDPNAWNRLTVTHANGSTDWTISLNGSAGYVTTGPAAGATLPWNGFLLYNDANAAATAYFDAVPVPEPSAVALLTAGLLGLLAYAWRKRK